MMRNTKLAGAVMVLCALCALPATGQAYYRTAVASTGIPSDPSCWSGSFGEMTNTCSDSERIYFYLNTDQSDYQASVFMQVFNPSSSSTVACDQVGVAPDVSTTATGFISSSGSGFQLLSIEDYLVVPLDGTMYVACTVPEGGAVVSVGYEEVY